MLALTGKDIPSWWYDLAGLDGPLRAPIRTCIRQFIQNQLIAPLPHKRMSTLQLPSHIDAKLVSIPAEMLSRILTNYEVFEPDQYASILEKLVGLTEEYWRSVTLLLFQSTCIPRDCVAKFVPFFLGTRIKFTKEVGTLLKELNNICLSGGIRLF